MGNTDNTNNEKPKGNMLQNENREDEASPENLTGEQQTEANVKCVENVNQQPNTTISKPVKSNKEDNNNS